MEVEAGGHTGSHAAASTDVGEKRGLESGCMDGEGMLMDRTDAPSASEGSKFDLKGKGKGTAPPPPMAQGTPDDPINLDSDPPSEPDLQDTATQPLDEYPLDEVDALEALCRDLLAFEGLLASPYPPYWARRVEEFAAAEELLTGPAFVCPNCGSAI